MKKRFLGLALGMTAMILGTTATPVQAGNVAQHYDIKTMGGTWDGTHYTLKDGTIAKNVFFCDGTYTYYLQADGTPMKDRLTYHPDGEHIIYFDEKGHEVFSDFTHVKKSIEGNPVDDLCFFNVFGYMYVDVLTYDKQGANLYYANPYGVMERNGWFQFSDGGLGYANVDGTLMKDQWTYDQLGNLVYIQGDAHVQGTGDGSLGIGEKNPNGGNQNNNTSNNQSGNNSNNNQNDNNSGGNSNEDNKPDNKPEDKPVHTHSYNNTVTKQPTCTEAGIRTFTCSCGASYTESIPATGHNWDAGTITTPATCEADGVKTYTCTKCGQTRTETISATGHTVGDWEITKPASTAAAQTLDDFGARVKKCTTCGTVLSEETIITIDMGNGETKQICGVFDDAATQEVFNKTNELRRSLGLNELTYVSGWEKYSKVRAAELDEMFSHDRPNGTHTLLGENIAEGVCLATAQEAFDLWCNSSGHYANIVNSSYTQYCGACFKVNYGNDNYGYYWVQNFQ